MANECILEEYQALDGNIQIPTIPLTTQIVSIGTAFAALSAKTKYVRIKSKGTGFWYDFAGNAAANTAGSTWLHADSFVDHRVTENLTNTVIDTAA